MYLEMSVLYGAAPLVFIRSKSREPHNMRQWIRELATHAQALSNPAQKAPRGWRAWVALLDNRAIIPITLRVNTTG
jgi:hypothetical protein